MGGSAKIAAAIRKLRADLVRDVMEQAGLTPRDAVDIVSNNLVGWTDAKGGTVARVIRASPDAIRLLSLKHKELAPQAADGWKSAHQLWSDYRGSVSAIRSKLSHFHDMLIEDVVAQTALDLEIAAAIVEHHLIGVRCYSGGTTLFASPGVVDLLELDGTLRRRNPKGQLCEHPGGRVGPQR